MVQSTICYHSARHPQEGPRLSCDGIVTYNYTNGADEGSLPAGLVSDGEVSGLPRSTTENGLPPIGGTTLGVEWERTEN